MVVHHNDLGLILFYDYLGKNMFVKLDRPWQIERGEEIGLFELGSSVICLFSRGQVEAADLQTGKPVRFGQSLGRFANQSG